MVSELLCSPEIKIKTFCWLEPVKNGVLLQFLFLHTGLRYLRFYSWIENLIFSMLSYQKHQVTSSCDIASPCIQGLLEAYFKINK